VNKKIVLAVAALAVVLIAAALFLPDWFGETDGVRTADLGPVIASGPFRVQVVTDPASPRVGQNQLAISLTDRDGEPVEAADLQAFAQMPAMGSMSAMRAGAELKETGPGYYRGAFELEMAGEWPLTVAIDKEGMGRARLVFDMATGRGGLKLASGGETAEREVAPESAASAMPKQEAGGIVTAGNYRLALKTDPARLAMGENRVTLHVEDREHNAASRAQVRGVAESKRDPARRVPIAFKEIAPGQYAGTLALRDEGDWTLAVDVESGALGHADLIFDLTAGKADLATATPEGIAYYTCSMHSSVRSAQPGQCPICSMDLVPVTHEELSSGTITLDSDRRQLIGLKLGEAIQRHLTRSVRAVGRVIYDETRLSEVTLRFDAWVGELKADFEGKPVEAGEPLFSIYGPELLSAQQEFLQLSQRAQSYPGLAEAAKKRLMLWGLTEGQVRALARRGRPFDYVPILSPVNGVIVEKRIVKGAANPTGTPLLKIADLTRVWVEAEVYESDLALVGEGMEAEVTLPYLADRSYRAKIDFIYPALKGETRTARLRLALENPDGALKPEMYAEVQLKADSGSVLAVPEEAVLYAGESRVVFVDLGDGRLKPTYVKTGISAEGHVQILEGLKPGDQVVTSGNFLIAAESRLKTGIARW
jgi:membrane fusion protein, copper/silver efflux system